MSRSFFLLLLWGLCLLVYLFQESIRMGTWSRISVSTASPTQAVHLLRRELDDKMETIKILLGQLHALQIAANSSKSTEAKCETGTLPDIDILLESDPTLQPKTSCCLALKRAVDIVNQQNKAIDKLKKKNAKLRNVNSDHLVNKKVVAFPRKSVYSLSTREGRYHETIPADYMPQRSLPRKLKEVAVQALKNIDHGLLNDSSLLSSDLFYRSDYNAGQELWFLLRRDDQKLSSVRLRRDYSEWYMTEPVDYGIEQLKGRLLNIIVPVPTERDRIVSFTRRLRQVCSDNTTHVTFVVHSVEKTVETETLIRNLMRNYSIARYQVVTEKLPFSRARALHQGVNRWAGGGNVVHFFCDIDVRFGTDFVRRCISIPKQRRAYFPILFSLYNPNLGVSGALAPNVNVDDISITKDTGSWRSTGFGMVCTLHEDYRSAKGFGSFRQHWGGEDLDLYARYLNAGIEVVRMPDPDLFHLWHPKTCDRSKLSPISYTHCLGSRAIYEGSHHRLGQLVIEMGLSKNCS